MVEREGGSKRLHEKLREIEAAKIAATDKAVSGLELLVKVVKTQRGAGATGQSIRVLRFLAGLYNGPRFPFDLTDLRALDFDLSSACLDILALDRFAATEIHKWGPVSAEELNELFQEAGLYYEVERRRIGTELYESKFPDGHPDEGL